MKMMNSIIALLFCTGLFTTAKFVEWYLESKNRKRVNLLANIHQKLFMTAWLGIFFASFFLLLTYLARHFLKKEFLLSALTYGKENPQVFFYLAGASFASIALLVYLVRMVAKRVYRRIQKFRGNRITN